MVQNRINNSSSILQVVTAYVGTLVSCTTIIPIDDTIPQNTEGDEVITLTITPKYSTSKLLIDFQGITNQANSVTGLTAALFQDSTANALTAKSYSDTIAGARSNLIRHIMTSGTTSSTTFKIRIGPGIAGSANVNGNTTANQLWGGVGDCFLIITEYL